MPASPRRAQEPSTSFFPLPLFSSASAHHTTTPPPPHPQPPAPPPLLLPHSLPPFSLARWICSLLTPCRAPTFASTTSPAFLFPSYHSFSYSPLILLVHLPTQRAPRGPIPWRSSACLPAAAACPCPPDIDIDKDDDDDDDISVCSFGRGLPAPRASPACIFSTLAETRLDSSRLARSLEISLRILILDTTSFFVRAPANLSRQAALRFRPLSTALCSKTGPGPDRARLA